MLISQQAGELDRRQGSRPVNLAELRRGLAEPTQLNGRHRQRLLDIARRVARVQALGDEYRRVSLSDTARDAIISAASV